MDYATVSEETQEENKEWLYLCVLFNPREQLGHSAVDAWFIGLCTALPPAHDPCQPPVPVWCLTHQGSTTVPLKTTKRQNERIIQVWAGFIRHSQQLGVYLAGVNPPEHAASTNHPRSDVGPVDGQAGASGLGYDPHLGLTKLVCHKTCRNRKITIETRIKIKKLLKNSFVPENVWSHLDKDKQAVNCDNIYLFTYLLHCQKAKVGNNVFSLCVCVNFNKLSHEPLDTF